MYEELRSIILKLASQEMNSSVNRYTNIRFIYLRIFKRIGQSMKIKFDDIYELKDRLFIHKHGSECVLDLWTFQTNEDETRTMENFLSADYCKPEDVIKMITVLFTHCKEYNKLNQLLAIDGLRGNDPEKYIENLKYPFYGELTTDPQETHARAIRTLYSTLSSYHNSYDLIYAMLYNRFKDSGIELPDEPKYEGENLQKFTTAYKVLVGEAMWAKIVKLYFEQ